MSDSGESDNPENASAPAETERTGEGNATPASVAGRGRGGRRLENGANVQGNPETLPPTSADAISGPRVRVSAGEILHNSTQSSGDSSVVIPVTQPQSAPPGVLVNRPSPEPHFQFPGFNQSHGDNFENASARLQTDTSGILLGMKNRQQAFQSKSDAQALRLANIESLSAKLEKTCIDAGNVLKSHSKRLEVAEGDIRYVSEPAATVGNQAEDLDQRVEHNSTCIGNLTGLIDGCSTLINQSNERYRNLESDLDKAKKSIQVIARKGPGANCSRPSIYPKVKLDIPTFEAEPFENSARFMDDLWTYMLALNCDEETMKLAIGQALKGPAREWWYYVEGGVFTLADFKSKFMDKFWDPREQDKVRREL
ncbi:hypothetical protein QAD02_023883 [Eretmocerus hayati]|uniref:Uncharacterized protein n=1 Tax=Eretmocerus hayati TaxID=131215 RepID=A0ACC2PX76_9HYME|nr:hypothetical protein QAD02_023883 [Eretmocerus hayati]